MRTKDQQKNKGFTLVELMVTVSIMIIMTSVVLFNYNQFNDSSLLNSFAYDLSLTIRQAQVYGAATREGAASLGSPSRPIDINSVNNFKSAYGIHFDTTSVYPMVMFSDSSAGGSSDGKYSSGIDVDIQKYSFQRGIKIKQICVLNSSNGCSSNPTSLDITFLRPDPEAIIMSQAGGPWGAAKIILQNADGTMTKSISVYSTGQISVQ